MTWTDLFFWIGFLSLIYFIIWIKEKLETRRACSNLLFERWRLARERRLLWKDQNYLNFYFEAPEYQQLFSAELAAEFLYLWYRDVECGEISWPDYRRERCESIMEEGEDNE